MIFANTSDCSSVQQNVLVRLPLKRIVGRDFNFFRGNRSFRRRFSIFITEPPISLTIPYSFHRSRQTVRRVENMRESARGYAAQPIKLYAGVSRWCLFCGVSLQRGTLTIEERPCFFWQTFFALCEIVGEETHFRSAAFTTNS